MTTRLSAAPAMITSYPTHFRCSSEEVFEEELRNQVQEFHEKPMISDRTYHIGSHALRVTLNPYPPTDFKEAWFRARVIYTPGNNQMLVMARSLIIHSVIAPKAMNHPWLQSAADVGTTYVPGEGLSGSFTDAMINIEMLIPCSEMDRAYDEAVNPKRELTPDDIIHGPYADSFAKYREQFTRGQF